jgi:hypothetical protein
MTINEDEGSAAGQPCDYAEGGYSDLGVGTQVTVRDEANKVLAVGELSRGTTQNWGDAENIGGTVLQLHRCVYPFSVSAVGPAATYGVEVSHRGQVFYAAADLERLGWHVDLSV